MGGGINQEYGINRHKQLYYTYYTIILYILYYTTIYYTYYTIIYYIYYTYYTIQLYTIHTYSIYTIQLYYTSSIKQMSNKDLLYNTGKNIQYLLITSNEKLRIKIKQKQCFGKKLHVSERKLSYDPAASRKEKGGSPHSFLACQS